MIAPSAIVFDFNGTLSDDEGLLADLFVRIFAEIGETVTRELYFSEYAGLSDPEIVADVVRRAGRDGEDGLTDRLLDRRTELYLDAVAGRSPVRPAAAGFARRAAARVPVAIASGAARREIEAVLESAGLRELFPVVVAAEDVERGKPDPEGYLRALRQLEEHAGRTLDPATVLVFEDSAAGLRSARAAGMRCIVVAGTADPQQVADAECMVPALDWSIPMLGVWS